MTVRDVAADVMHLLLPPTALFAPGIAIRVARDALRERPRRSFAPRRQPRAWPAMAAAT
jgi:hypothetical protein